MEERQAFTGGEPVEEIVDPAGYGERRVTEGRPVSGHVRVPWQRSVEAVGTTVSKRFDAPGCAERVSSREDEHFPFCPSHLPRLGTVVESPRFSGTTLAAPVTFT
ncbi:hypothetical protein GCM10018791_27450 [Streptomyces zaomyceticus]|nr:hypothetical protein GCM10018791_27450 [Streptomyces zaomyceticus]